MPLRNLLIAAVLAGGALTATAASTRMDAARVPDRAAARTDVDAANANSSPCAALAGRRLSVDDGVPVAVASAKVVMRPGMPAYCEVTGFVAPQVGFVVRLPEAGWNGRLLHQGCSGFCGVFEIDAADDALARGYAVGTNDMGHRGASTTSAIWAWDNPVAERDFWYRANHVATAALTEVVRTRYGREARYRYWRGCGTGGRSALTEAQRFPEDYDGVVSCGGAVLDFVLNTYAIEHFLRANRRGDGSEILDKADLATLHEAALANCDARDGLLDGVLADPLACRFDPASLACPEPRDAACLSPEQIDAARKFYAGPTDAAGATLYPGQAVGSEPTWATLYFGQKRFFDDFVADAMRYLMYAEDPGPRYVFGPEGLHERVETFAATRRASSSDAVDFGAFSRRGAKLLVAYGWNEPAMPGRAAVEYYERVAQANGGLSSVARFFRLFMVPGTFVCVSGAPLGQQIDFLTAIEQWVEQGVAPDRLVATLVRPGQSAQVRPLFPYPSYARYHGGPPDSPDSYVAKPAVRAAGASR